MTKVHVYLNASVLFLLALIAGQGMQASHDASRPVLAHSLDENPSFTPAKDLGARDKRPGSLCQASGGLWLACLWACECPDEQLFSHATGCTPITLFPGDANAGIQRLGALSIARGDRGSLADLAGVAIGIASNSEDSIFLKIANLTPMGIDLDLTSNRPMPLGIITTRYPQRSERGLLSEQEHKHCVAMLANMGAANETDSIELCSSLVRAVEALRDGVMCVAGPPVFKRRDVGEHRIDLWVANLPAAMGFARYRILGAGGAPAVRTLELSRGEGLVLDTLISPLGELMGGRAIVSLTTSDTNEALLHRQVLYFDGHFAPIHVDEGDFGQRQVLRQAAKQILTQSLLPTKLATDGARSPILGSVSAMVLEMGLDISATALMHRINFSWPNLESLATSGTLKQGLLPARVEPVRSILDILSDLPESGCRHGTAVASLLVRDLPRIQVSLFPLGRHDWLKDIDGARTALIEAILTDAPRVVNISMDFAEEVGHCEAMFGPIFERFKDSVLFVVAAGNSGHRHSAAVCPGGMAAIHANAINVGGTSSNGSLHPSSNFGAEIVDIAAPYCELAITGGDLESKSALQEECGTSMAVPQVGNAALRLFALAPHLRPAEVKKMLMDSCEQKGLDVACGGQLDLRILDQIEASLNPLGGHPLLQPNNK